MELSHEIERHSDSVETFFVLALTSAASAGTRSFIFANTPSTAFTYNGGLSGYQLTASIVGSFSITTDPDRTVRLHDFDLRLANVAENIDLPNFDVEDFENKPVKDFLPIDLTTTTVGGRAPFGSAFIFAPDNFENPGEIPTEPTAGMLVEITGNQAVVTLGAQLNEIRVTDGASIRFLPLTAMIVPEPATVTMGGFALLALLRRRK